MAWGGEEQMVYNIALGHFVYYPQFHYFIFCGDISCSSGWPQTHFTVKDYPEFLIILTPGVLEL